MIKSNNSEFINKLNEPINNPTDMYIDFTSISIGVTSDTITLSFMYSNNEIYTYRFDKPILEEFTANIDLMGALKL